MTYAIINPPAEHPSLDLAKQTCPAAYDTISFDRKGRADGSALHHEYYDLTADAGIICIRRTEGSKYGVKTLSKKYYLLENIAGVATRTPLEGRNIAALAQKAELGQVVARMMSDSDIVRRALVDGAVIVRRAGTERAPVSYTHLTLPTKA